MSSGPVLPHVAIPLRELQFGLQDALQPRQGKKFRTMQGKNDFITIEGK